MDEQLQADLRLATSSAETELRLHNRSIEAWWHSMGHVGQVIDEVKMLREYVKRPGVSTVCEVGFNAGHSAIALLSGQQTKLIEFDKQDLQAAATYLLDSDQEVSGKPLTFNIDANLRDA